MKDTAYRLRERVKELNCLYEISRVAWLADNDVNALIDKALEIIPAAMQFPDLAEIEVYFARNRYSTDGFGKVKKSISAKLKIEGVIYGSITIGYRPSSKVGTALNFLPEEKNLLEVVARELALFIKRSSVEEEKQKLQIQLQHVERLAFVGELTAGIAHELNEPLAKILGFAQLLKKAENLDNQQTQDINRIVKASLYTREIIKKLMIFSRQMPQQISNINLNEIVTNILYFIDVRFQSSGIRLRTKLDSGLPLIKGDEVQLSQVLVNLITNAVHAMPKGGDIMITTKRKGKVVSLVVTDTGNGMTAEVREKIFEPFFTTKPVGQGTGLGLSVVKGIVDTHHGKITVVTSPGKGSKFEIQLPLRTK